ncbi:MAG: hypothetical protein ACFB2W_05255 [Leptolyngbyaceae cyanobacterium]
MFFPIWQYLNQPLWNKAYPLMLSPARYWQQYKVAYLDSCLNNAFLEQCWQVDYQTFVDQNQDFCDRTALEEDPIWLMERCWQREYRHPRYQRAIYQKLENLTPEQELE